MTMRTCLHKLQSAATHFRSSSQPMIMSKALQRSRIISTFQPTNRKIPKPVRVVCHPETTVRSWRMIQRNQCCKVPAFGAVECSR